jgi:hypothetical protein
MCLIARYSFQVGYIEQPTIIPRKLLFGAIAFPVYVVDDVLRHKGRSNAGTVGVTPSSPLSAFHNMWIATHGNWKFEVVLNTK